MRNNNKGSVILIVLITVALIAVLATMILATTSISFKIKTLAEAGNKNFYSCETALDEIKVGLQAESSDCYITTYMDILNDNSVDSKVSRFYQDYKLEMKMRLRNPDETTAFSVEKLESYLSEGVLFNADTNKGIVIAPSTANSILQRADGILLKNVDVTYFKNEDSSTRIVTDILIKYPPVEFDKLNDNPPLMFNALISDKGILVNDLNNKITGSLYSGNDGQSNDSLVISGDNSKASLIINNSYNAVVNGDILIDNQSELYSLGQTNLWGRNIIMDGSTYLKTQGYLNLVNDLWIGKNCNLEMSGSYFGFGNPNNYSNSQYLIDKGITEEDSLNDPRAEHTSAILINGKSVNLNLSRISYLLLGGSASIGTSTNGSYNLIQTGESIGIKGNQLAYMVPDSMMNNCSNPVTEEEYILKGGNCVNLNSSDYETIYYTLPGDYRMVYFFMKFGSVDEAATYFSNYYSSNMGYVNSLMNNYDVNIMLPLEGVADVDAVGNTMEYTNTGISSISSNSIDSDVLESMSDREDIYGMLCTKLMKNYSAATEEEKALTVFENIVSYDDFRIAFNGSYSNKPIRIYETEITSENIVLTGIVINDQLVDKVVLNNGLSPSGNGYSFSDGVVNIYPNEINARIITSYSDVEFNGCNYKGLVITKGNAYLKQGSILTNDPTDISLVMFAENDDDEMYCDIFKNGDAYLIGGSFNEQSVFSDLVVFSNWTKE